ncbi:MAG TPA: KamA family radical SAM protein [Verrucomicrobiae bacterium]|nr:KamA family radical SAM protein [Verrucomicrobiae bacterium]
MERWLRAAAAAVTDIDEVCARFGADPAPLRETAAAYPLSITGHYLSLIRRAGDPLWMQCVPDPRELQDRQEPDPLHEESLSPVPGLIHRYADRAVWLVSGSCAVRCRFCMRKRRFGACSEISLPDPEAVFAYLDRHPEIVDVVLSGGDPLMLPDEQLDELLTGLRRIRSVQVVRIGTRLPVTLPERITRSLCRMLRKHHPVYLNTHFNHPQEISPASAEACARLADAGIPLGNQTVLLRGVNDDPATMRTLVRELLRMRVRPYYIHQMDLVQGTAHFRTPLEEGLRVMEGLRGHVSGLAVPYFVIDAEGGKGKVPVLPETCRRVGEGWELLTRAGETVRYLDP